MFVLVVFCYFFWCDFDVFLFCFGCFDVGEVGLAVVVFLCFFCLGIFCQVVMRGVCLFFLWVFVVFLIWFLDVFVFEYWFCCDFFCCGVGF